MMFVSVLDDFMKLRHVQDPKLLFEPECTISGYQSCEASILVHWTQNNFSVSDNFTNLQDVKRCKTYVLGLNALFWGTKVVK
jgi:hypothetical protein